MGRVSSGLVEEKWWGERAGPHQPRFFMPGRQEHILFADLQAVLESRTLMPLEVPFLNVGCFLLAKPQD